MKKLSVANGTYMKDGVQKTNWVSVGVIGTSANGKEYMLIDPTINFAGFQREQGKDMVMVGIFDDAQNNQGQPSQGYGGQPAPQGGYAQGGYVPPSNNNQPPPPNNPPVEYYDVNGLPLPPR